MSLNCGWYLVINLYFLVLELGRLVDAATPLCRYLIAPNLERTKVFDSIKVDNSSPFLSFFFQYTNGFTRTRELELAQTVYILVQRLRCVQAR